MTVETLKSSGRTVPTLSLNFILDLCKGEKIMNVHLEQVPVGSLYYCR